MVSGVQRATQKAAQLGSSASASLALRSHVATAIPSDCSENSGPRLRSAAFALKELDPYHRRCRTVHQRIEATTPDEPRVANAKISTCMVVSINHFGGRLAQKSTTRSSQQERRKNAELGLLRQRRQKTRQPRELQANARRQPSEMLSHRQLLYVMFQRSDNVPSASPPGQ